MDWFNCRQKLLGQIKIKTFQEIQFTNDRLVTAVNEELILKKVAKYYLQYILKISEVKVLFKNTSFQSVYIVIVIISIIITIITIISLMLQYARRIKKAVVRQCEVDFHDNKFVVSFSIRWQYDSYIHV